MNNINYASIQEIHYLFTSKQLTVRELVLKCLSRIAEIDKCENGLNSVLEINPDVLFLADALDRKLKNNEDMQPLFGIPILLKDNINTADKLHTSAGSVALADNYAPYDAPIVKCLRESGALIMGKANMTEFSHYMSDMPSGYSSRGGQTLNPYNKNESPGTSSSGSAVAVAAGLCTVSIGVETGGSIIGPSQENGIVGIKPTAGLLSSYGIIPISFTLDTPGPMARTVTDTAILLGAMAKIDYTQYLDKNGLKYIRVGINRMYTENTDKDYLSRMENIINTMKEHGTEFVELSEHCSPFVSSKNNALSKYEFKCGINSYLASLSGQNKVPKNLQEIILYNQNNEKEALKYGQNILINAQNNTSGTLSEPDYINAILWREEILRELESVFLKNNVDVILVLSGYTVLAPLTGFPSMTIPIGQKQNKVPFGSYWMARRFDEASLIKVTYAVEQILGLHLKPEVGVEG